MSALASFRLDTLDDPSAVEASLTALNDLLADPYAESLEDELRGRYEASALSPKVQGTLSFYYFCRAADRWNSGRLAADKDICDALLADSHLRDVVEAYYRLPPKYLTYAMRLYRVGTTSFIVGLYPRVDQRDPTQILKIVKPTHLRNPTIASALEDTLTCYGVDDFKDFVPEYDEELPALYRGERSGARRFLAMKFIKGYTLREALVVVSRLRPKERADECLRLSRVVAQEVCNHLHQLSVYELSHLDLSPDNLILSEGRRADSITLLDFGVNHVLRGASVASSSEVLRAARYVSPELLKTQDLRSVSIDTADSYSLGMILLELVAGCDPSLRDRGPSEFLRITEENSETLLERIRGIDFLVASKLEAMVDRNANTRVYEYRRDTKLYRNLRQDLVAALDQFSTAAKGGWLSPLPRVLARTSRNVPSRLSYWSSFVAIVTSMWDQEGRRTILLAQCRVVSFLAFGVLVLAGWDSAVRNWEGNWRDVWPGWIVAATFSFVATKYYQSICAGISAAGLDNFTEWVIRLNALSYVFPIWYAFSIDPTAWAACCAFGVSIVAVTNYLMLRLARRSETRIAEAGFLIPRPIQQASFQSRFGGWPQMTFVYAGALCVLHVLIRTGWLQDIWFYACVVVLLNIKMFVGNCTKAAPPLREGLLWLFENARRAESYRADLLVPLQRRLTLDRGLTRSADSSGEV